MTRHKTRHLLLLVALFAASYAATAQHTLGFMAGYGMANGRFDPKMETRAQWGIYTGGLSWRYYGTQRFVGKFHLMVRFIAVTQAFHDAHSLFFGGLTNSDRLETAFERTVFFQVLAVFINGSCTNNLNFTAR